MGWDSSFSVLGSFLRAETRSASRRRQPKRPRSRAPRAVEDPSERAFGTALFRVLKQDSPATPQSLPLQTTYLRGRRAQQLGAARGNSDLGRRASIEI